MMGLDAWPEQWVSREENKIRDNKFAESLNVDYFVMPPDDSYHLPVLRFPEFVSCSKCHRLNRWEFLAATDTRTKEKQNFCRFCNSKDAPLITSRFVSACAAGHIDDFPYFFWVHRGAEGLEDNHELFLRVNPKDDSLKGLRVDCTCGATRSLEGALGKGAVSRRCSGKAIWLQESQENGCSEKLVGLQRGATRVWQAETKSHISIEVPESDLERKVRDKFDTLRNIEETNLRVILNYIFPGEDVTKIIQILDRLKNQYADAIDLRQQEYDAFQTNYLEKSGSEEFVCEVSSFPNEARVKHRIELTSQVPRMKEVRALVGFSRIDPQEDTAKLPLLSQSPKNWLPAIEVFGEGIFLKVDEKALNEWEKSEFAQDRVDLINGAGAEDESKKLTSARKLLLHSLSHVLLNELALITGYPASSITERIFSEPNQSGIFLYTATSDSAGSLGGLCAQGSAENLIKLLENAIQSASWCSADPVCIESHPHGVNHSNLAACHYCMLAPEVSCEHRNLHLDRACLIGTPDEPSAGFFSHLS